jgi:hypothetical protein
MIQMPLTCGNVELWEVFTFRAGLGKRGLAGGLPTG